MFVVYGWLKETRPLRPLLDCYCYVCQRRTSWTLWRETEWVTLFGMKTLPFISKDALACERCGDEVALAGARSRRLQHGEPAQETASFLETHQLASKTEVQRNFLISTRAMREREQEGYGGEFMLIGCPSILS